MKVILILAALVAVASATIVSVAEWNAYKAKHNKFFTGAEDNNRKFIYSVSKSRCETHNARFNRGLEEYSVALNQFSDLTFVNWATYFPKTVPNRATGFPATIPTQAAPATFDYRNIVAGINVFDQAGDRVDLRCSAGWAFATATSVQIFIAMTTPTPIGALSAQQLLDCAGGSDGCTGQVAKTGFEYLTTFAQSLQTAASYQPYHYVQGSCIVNAVAPAVQLTQYAVMPPTSTEAQLKAVMAFVGPPTVQLCDLISFELMHYSAGTFTQPSTIKPGCHTVVLIGYGTNAAGRTFWLAQNSWGTSWGAGGYIQIDGRLLPTLLANAVYPTQ